MTGESKDRRKVTCDWFGHTPISDYDPAVAHVLSIQTQTPFSLFRISDFFNIFLNKKEKKLNFLNEDEKILIQRGF